MASPEVSAEYLKAGADYLRAVRELGMRPIMVGWGWETATSNWNLMVVTSIVEAGGPFALNRLLFKAYNVEATPKEISPFIVRVFAPEIVPPMTLLVGQNELKIARVQDKFGKEKNQGDWGKSIGEVSTTFMGLELRTKNMYHIPAQPKKGYHDRRHEWQMFKRNVERLAA
jgi:hypothetical protein